MSLELLEERRERWGSKLGVILAVVGSDIGLGNFLVFSTQAVRNESGAQERNIFITTGTKNGGRSV